MDINISKSNAAAAIYSIPEKLNIFIFFVFIVLDGFLLWTASHYSLLYMFVAAFLFAFIHNTLFSLMHEAVHGVFSKSSSVNEFFGIILGATFPTSFTMQKIAHLGHHKRNRTDKELYDYYLPHESKTLRNIWMYGGNLLGLYWFIIPISNLLIIAMPMLFKSQWFVHGPAKTLGFESYLEEIVQYSIVRIWFEAFFALIYQVTLWYILDLSWEAWLLCHWFFALHWSALQYVDHAWSPRDIINGAWNLRVLPISRWLALNYHYHLAHHRHPLIPWIHLPKFVREDDAKPTFWSIYFSLWGGTKPAPPMVINVEEKI
jgi:fatty acid desaturase